MNAGMNGQLGACESQGEDRRGGGTSKRNDRGRGAPILFRSARRNLTSTEMRAMPDKDIEDDWRRAADSGGIPNERGFGAIINKALRTEGKERLPHEWLFELGRVIIGRHLAFGLPIYTLQHEDVQELAALREGVLCLALIDTAQHPEWFDLDALLLELEACMERVRQPDDSDIFGLAAAFAEETPIILTEEVTSQTASDPSRLIQAASIGFYLHKLSDGKVFTYPSGRLGELWGYEQEVARRNGRNVLRVLEKAGLLEVAAKAVTCVRATSYRFCERRRDLYQLPAKKAKPRH